MANYIKSFNFRNGVQVDNDNFIVNSSGRVGVGTTAPTKLLDVNGSARIVNNLNVDTKLIAADASVTGILTVGNITINGSTGIITAPGGFEGSAGQNFGGSNIISIATDGFVVETSGLTTTSNVGIATNSIDGTYQLQVGGDPTISGFGVTSGNIVASGNLSISGITTLGVTTTTDLTAQSLDVSGISTLGVTTTTDLTAQSLDVSGITTLGVTTTTDLTTQSLDVSGISTIGVLKIGTGITASGGIITATTFDGNLTGNVTGNVTGNLVGVISTTGICTVGTLKIGTGITASDGIITATTFDGTVAVASSLSNSRDFSITGDLEASIVSFDGTANVSLASTLSNSFSANTSGIITAATVVSSGIGSFTSIGIQTSSPSADLQIRKASGESKIEVISDTGTASISIGNSVGTGNSSASINYGSTSGFNAVYSTNQSLDIINHDTGNINYSLGNNVTNDKAFHWHSGVGNDQLMSLTKQGFLGIGITNPEHVLSVQGISTFTGSAYFDSDVTIEGTLTIPSISATLKGDVQDTSSNVILDVSNPLLNANVNTTTGISTFNNVKASAVGIGTTSPRCILDLEEATDNTTGFVLFPSRTTAGRNNISPVGSGTTIEGSIIYNSTNKRLEFYNGTHG